MRVVHVGFSDNRPGAASANYRLHRALRDLGVDSRMSVIERVTDDDTVVAPDGVRRRWSKAAQRIEGGLSRRLGPPEGETTLAVLGSGVVQQALRLDPDIVQLGWLGGGAATVGSLRRLKGVPVVWRLSDLWPLSGTQHYAGTSRAHLTGYPRLPTSLDSYTWNKKRRTFRLLKDLNVVSPSEWLAGIARESVLFRDRSIEVIRTGVDLERFRLIDPGSGPLRDGLPRDSSIVLFGAAWSGTPRKGADLFAGALHALRDKVIDDGKIVVVSFGSDPPPPGLPFPTRHLGAVTNEDDLAAIYASADVFVAPSREENLANTVLEALACGVPVVAFDIGGMPEAIDHGTSGYLAKPFDVADLATGIDMVLRTAAEGDRSMSHAARRKAEVHFDLETRAAEWVELYRRVLSRKRDRS